MSDTADRKSPFWRFSVKFYAVPGVAPACIDLQDQAGVDVNVLFFLLWSATESRAFDKAGVEEIERAIGPWRDMAVAPLRNVRRALKSPPPALAADVAEAFRTRIKAVELEAERLQQETMYALVATAGMGRAAASPDEAVRTSVSAYQSVLGLFPPGPLGTILAAFAKFDPPR